MIKTYYHLTKPGIVYGNALTAIAGFFLATTGPVNWILLVAMVLGLSCIIGSACVINNYFDRHIDAKMERTKTRALVAGHISSRSALAFAGILLLLGVALLYYYTHTLTLNVALFGFIVYVVLYTPLKHYTGHALWVGAIAGATPPVVGYTAVTNTLDLTALWLFLFLFAWQVPHFLAIAAYRYDEYAAAGVPLLVTKPKTEKGRRLARRVFFGSLVVLLVWCVVLLFI